MTHNKNCVYCKDNIKFKLPEEIIKAAINNNLVLFVGSGISTESKNVYPYTFYEDIASELNLDTKIIKLTFSELMSKYCEKPNGKKELLKKIRERIDYVKSFKDLYDMATRFHKELSSIYLIKEIFTTNWDDFFEIECGAIPFVTSDDSPFWDIPKRKVFKIHGSINNIGSIVATKEDYKKCYKRLKNQLIGNYLKVNLSTKLVVFIGYSFQDEDFNRIYSILKKDLGNLIPHSYIVTLEKNIVNKFNSSLITPIITDGTYFIHTLKNMLIKEKIMLDNSVGLYADMVLEMSYDIHSKIINKIKMCDYPDIIYSCSYIDGIIHALERFNTLKCTGDYHNEFRYHQLFCSYEEIRKKKIHIKRYPDVAYIDGYLNGLTVLLVKNKKELKIFPYFYIYGFNKDIKNFNKYYSIIKNKNIYHKNAHEYAKKIILSKKIGKDIFYRHTPFLL
jgi:NAD-dependent SIR2 family protein deacetylase